MTAGWVDLFTKPTPLSGVEPGDASDDDLALSTPMAETLRANPARRTGMASGDGGAYFDAESVPLSNGAHSDG